jgi:ABC-type glycerol-3-phosphate transport system substrate-binding protein
MATSLRVLLVGRPMYDPLYARLGEFGEREGVEVEAAVAPSHPELNERIEEEFGSGAASYDLYDLISTHAKYALSQNEWPTPLDDLRNSELDPFAPRPLQLARIDGFLYGVPRNLDVKLLYHRTTLIPELPDLWEELRDEVAQLRSDEIYGDSLGDVRSEAPAGSVAEQRWRLLEEVQEAALIPPKHENYPAVEDAIWQGLREALLGKGVEETLRETQEATRGGGWITS